MNKKGAPRKEDQYRVFFQFEKAKIDELFKRMTIKEIREKLKSYLESL